MNSAFHRDDALVIVVAITDEDEQPTGAASSAEEVYSRLAKTVNNDPRRMVFLGIGGSRRCNGTYGSALEATKLKAITDLFAVHGRGVFWDLCEGKLEDGLEEAFQVIENACTDLCALDSSTCTGDNPPPGTDPECAVDDPDCAGNGTIPPTTTFCDEYPDDPSCELL